MLLTADGHVHLYPCYDAKTALDSLRRNLARTAGTAAVQLAFLAERSDCHFFRELAGRGPAMLRAPVQVDKLDNALLLREEGYPDLYIFAGRQVISAERVELLALTTDAAIPDGRPAVEAVGLIQRTGGLPIVSWAPGKWFFSRGRVVARLLERFQPGTLLVGDTSLRPVGWPTPLLMRRALTRGFGLVAGSDPLPFAGEERILGTYGMQMKAAFDREDPVGSMRAVLARPGFMPALTGGRGGFPATLRRLLLNSRARKERAGAGPS